MKTGKSKRKWRYGKGAGNEEPRLPSSMGPAIEDTDKRIGHSRVRALDLAPSREEKEDRLPRKTRELLRAMERLNGHHSSKLKKRKGELEENLSQARGKKRSSETPEPRSRIELQGMGKKESWKDFNQRIARETRKAVSEEPKGRTRRAEKGKALYEKKHTKTKERKRRRRKRRARAGSCSESECEYEESEDGNDVKRRRIRHPVDPVVFGERVEAPPVFSALPKMRSRTGRAPLSKRKGGAIATVLAKASGKSAGLLDLPLKSDS